MLQYNPTVSGSSTVSGSIYVNSPNQTMGQFVGNQNGYVEFSIRNTNTGASASGDIAVYADNGTVTNNYIDMGINNSGLDAAYFYGGTDFGNALDAYVYNVGGNLRIGNATSAAPYSQSLYLFSNPAATPNITISGSQVAISKTGSLNGTFDVLGNAVVTGSVISTVGFTGSLLGTATTASYVVSSQTDTTQNSRIAANEAKTGSYATTGSNIFTSNQTISGSLTTTGTITAQTIVVQTISSSIEYASGSNRFGQNTGNTHQFTGSVLVSGSQTVNGSAVLSSAVSSTGGLFDLKNTSASSNSNIVDINFWTGNSNTGLDKIAKIYAINPSAGGNNYGDIVFQNYSAARGGMFENMRITSAGNVGIGTAPTSSWYSGNNSVALELSATGNGLWCYGSTTNITTYLLNNTYYTNASGFLYGQSGGGASYYRQNNGSHDWGTAVSGTANATASFSSRMTITSGGNVGIGTASPSSLVDITKSSNSGGGSTFPRLSVSNILATQGDGSTTYNFADLRVAAGNAAVEVYLTATYASGTWTPQGILNVATNHPLAFKTNNTERMQISAAGNVSLSGGSGSSQYQTSSPINIRFDNAYSSGYTDASLKLYLFNSGTTIQGFTSGPAYDLQYHSSGNASGRHSFYINNTEIMRVNSSGSSVTGAITATGDVTAYSSDKRLKENVVKIPSALDKVLSLNGVTYDWNKKALDFGFVPDRLKHDVGLLAQEVEYVLPEAIAPAPFDTNQTTGESISGENYLTVRYDKLVPLLIEAIKEQQTQIDKLNKLLNN
jgi:hypothetical protein